MTSNRGNPKWKDKVDITYEEYFRSHPLTSPEGFVNLVRTMEEELGKERAHEILLKSRKKVVEKSVKRNMGDKRIKSLRDFMKRPRPSIYQWALIREDEEASDDRYAFKIQSCLWAKTWGELDAQDIGYMVTCYSDNLSAEAMNPKLRLERKGTLMQGAPYCDFCFTWKK